MTQTDKDLVIKERGGRGQRWSEAKVLNRLPRKPEVRTFQAYSPMDEKRWARSSVVEKGAHNPVVGKKRGPLLSHGGGGDRDDGKNLDRVIVITWYAVSMCETASLFCWRAYGPDLSFLSQVCRAICVFLLSSFSQFKRAVNASMESGCIN